MTVQMEALLVKLFATALALSQVTTTPDAAQTEFDRQRDQPQVAHILHAAMTAMQIRTGLCGNATGLCTAPDPNFGY
jgi:hypothetical protein